MNVIHIEIMVKSKKIIFRVKPDFFNFVNEFAKSVKMERSELMRKIVEHYFLMYFSNNQTSTYEELKDKFLSIQPKSLSEEQQITGESKE